MISDSDGKNFPWYGNKTEVVQINGPQRRYKKFNVTMNDNFHPHITWDIPVGRRAHVTRLTRVKRDQTFYTWLVAYDILHGNFMVLKTYCWSIKVDILVDPNKELGQRAKLLSRSYPKQPRLIKINISIPICTLGPPYANISQILIWYPVASKRKIILKAKA